MKKVAISACLLGEACRYDGTDNRNDLLLEKLKGCELIPFCPEDNVFGTPRPTMDLVETESGIKALSNATGADLSSPVEAYGKGFSAAMRISIFLSGRTEAQAAGSVPRSSMMSTKC